MTTAGIRSLLAATTVAAVLSYGLSGHGLPHVTHDEMAGAIVGVCLLVATVLTYVVARDTEARDPAVLTDAAPTYVAAPELLLPDARARASPTALKRFRN